MPWAFENVRMRMTLGSSASIGNTADAGAKSMYASSSTNSAVSGNASMNARRSAASCQVPMGLSGLAR